VDTAADRAASGIRALIVSLDYGPGDRLPAERDLAQQLGVSRPALREGIRRLRSGGVLESRRGSGTYVSVADLAGVYDIRVRLEPLAAERAAQLRTDLELEALRSTYDLMEQEIEDPERFNFADARFHTQVADASRSVVLTNTLERLSELALLTRSVIAPDRRFRVSSLADVERILLAIERQHPKRAANAMERHIRNVRDDYATVTKTASRSIAAGQAPAASA
jgi:GntR family transcriptional regulator, transcriptional repressor for pyruvate dehydrogenase complex